MCMYTHRFINYVCRVCAYLQEWISFLCGEEHEEFKDGNNPKGKMAFEYTVCALWQIAAKLRLKKSLVSMIRMYEKKEEDNIEIQPFVRKIMNANAKDMLRKQAPVLLRQFSIGPKFGVWNRYKLMCRIKVRDFSVFRLSLSPYHFLILPIHVII